MTDTESPLTKKKSLRPSSNALGMVTLCVEIPYDLMVRLRKLCTHRGDQSNFIREGIAMVINREERRHMILKHFEQREIGDVL